MQAIEIGDNNRQKLVGVTRTTVQGLFAYVLAAVTPLLDMLGATDEFGALEAPITALAVAVVLGVYWLVLTTIQESELGKNPLIAGVLAILMGGNQPPTYICLLYTSPSPRDS